MTESPAAVRGAVGASADKITLECRGVWKLFGARAGEVLRSLGSGATVEAIAAAGLVPAVRDVSL